MNAAESIVSTKSLIIGVLEVFDRTTLADKSRVFSLKQITCCRLQRGVSNVFLLFGGEITCFYDRQHSIFLVTVACRPTATSSWFGRDQKWKAAGRGNFRGQKKGQCKTKDSKIAAFYRNSSTGFDVSDWTPRKGTGTGTGRRVERSGPNFNVGDSLATGIFEQKSFSGCLVILSEFARLQPNAQAIAGKLTFTETNRCEFFWENYENTNKS